MIPKEYIKKRSKNGMKSIDGAFIDSCDNDGEYTFVELNRKRYLIDAEAQTKLSLDNSPETLKEIAD